MGSLVKKTLAEQLYDILKNDIISRNIKPGEQLTLLALQERFGVSSTPIRQAITRLVEDELVVFQTNIGAKVIQLTEKDIREVYVMASELEQLAIRFSYEAGNSEKVVRALKENTDIVDKALKSGDYMRWSKYSDMLHEIFYEYCDNSRLQALASKLRVHLTLCSQEYEELDGVRESITEEHRGIAEAYINGDISKAEELMKKHLLHSMDYALKAEHSD